MAVIGTMKRVRRFTLFVKTPEKNWLVPLHRDLSVPVREPVEGGGWSHWTTKGGTPYARPPRELLDRLLAVRVHLEETGPDNGALKVVPGSHLTSENEGPRETPTVPRGGAFVMRPSLLHASAKIRSGRRRVLHFVFGPPDPPGGAQWLFSF